MTGAGEGVLYLAHIDKDFDPETDMALDPWCFVGREDIYPDWQRLDFIDPVPGLEDVEAELAKIRPWLTVLVRGLTDDLNARHGTAYSQDFWRIMTMTWLSELAQRVWKHYLLIEQVIEKLGDRPMRATVLAAIDRSAGLYGALRAVLDVLSRTPARRPGPLEVVASQPAGHVHHLADEIKPRMVAALQGLR